MFYFLSERFPHSENLLSEIKRILLIGILFYIFFSVVSPFQTGQGVVFFLYLSLLIIGISVVVHLALHKVVVGFAWDAKWTIGKEIVKSLVYLVLIATGMFVTLGVLGHVPLSLISLSRFIVITTAYGAIPIALRTMWVQNKRLTRQLRNLSNRESKESSPKIELISPVKSDSYSCLQNDLMYFKSDENYLIAVEKEKKTHIRLTMKSAIEQLSGFPFQRVHRSYLVNGQLVKKVRSNHLIMEGNIRIPISRQFRKEFVEKNTRFN